MSSTCSKKTDKNNEGVTVTPSRSIDKPTGAPNAEGLYELTPRMSNILEKELQNIMIKVWQVLPDNGSNDAERLVIDELRNNAGDDLRNVLGLNATKRLLNIYNPLNAKMVFHKRPEGPSVKAFIQKYNIRGIKKVENQLDTFAIQFKSIKDFDKLCTAKDVRCGDIKVTITSCYKFTQCPDQIKTMYCETSEEIKGKVEKYKEPASKITENKTIVNSKDSKQYTNKTPEIMPSKNSKATKEQSTIENPSGNKKESTKKAEHKKNSQVKAKVIPSAEKLKVKNVKPTVSKEDNINRIENKVTNKRPLVKIVPEMSKIKSKVTTKKSKKMMDDEELNDHEILALLSGGIVIDECSGSDIE